MCFACMYVYTVCAYYPCGFPGTGVVDGCEPLYGFWELTLVLCKDIRGSSLWATCPAQQALFSCAPSASHHHRNTAVADMPATSSGFYMGTWVNSGRQACEASATSYGVASLTPGLPDLPNRKAPHFHSTGHPSPLQLFLLKHEDEQ